MIESCSTRLLPIAFAASSGACTAQTADDPESAPDGSDSRSMASSGSIATEARSLTGATDGSAARRPEVTVWKSPTCGCCSGWVDYLREEGFDVTTHDTDALDAVKAELGLVDPALKSCHTATIGGYVVEGHVPVSDIERLLAERPVIVGISAPGMPMMSPGMGSREPKDYDVIAFDREGGTETFARH